jgi:glycosyltransferase involved in cell wall biosynthesis
MRVAVASVSPFWAFDLARQMERRSWLELLYTTYPRRRAAGLPESKVKTFPWLMAPAVAARRAGLERLGARLNVATIESFDRWMAARLRPCDVFHCLSSFGTGSHLEARRRFGALTVCDRGSSHIAGQVEIMREEHARFGVPYRPPDPRIIARELQEYAECDLVMVPSRFAWRSFADRGVAETKLRLSPYGVDLAMFRSGRRRDAVFRVLFVGAISLRKGVAYLLEAANSSGIPGLEVWLVGPIERAMRPILAKYEGIFRHFGPIPRARLADYYSQASVLVLPSVEEGLALVQAQAMACGVPVIATANTGAEDLFTDGVEGFIVPIRDAAAIRSRLLRLYENPDERDRMASAALARAKSLGGWDQYGDRMAQHYGTALEARDGR